MITLYTENQAPAPPHSNNCGGLTVAVVAAVVAVVSAGLDAGGRDLKVSLSLLKQQNLC